MAKRRIALKIYGDLNIDEAVAGGAVTPGHLVSRDSADKFVVHPTEGGVAQRMFATEDALQGASIDQAYATTGTYTRVSAVKARRGDEVNAYIKAGQNIAIGDILISAGDGTLIKDGTESSGTTVKDHVAVAREAVDLTASGAVNTRIKVEVL